MRDIKERRSAELTAALYIIELFCFKNHYKLFIEYGHGNCECALFYYRFLSIGVAKHADFCRQFMRCVIESVFARKVIGLSVLPFEQHFKVVIFANNYAKIFVFFQKVGLSQRGAGTFIGVDVGVGQVFD